MRALESLADLDSALAITTGVVVLYKHSTRCGICDDALVEVKDFLERQPGAATVFYLDLLEHRDVSNAIAERLGVRHESPQALVLRDGRLAGVLSHRSIRTESLAKAVAL